VDGWTPLHALARHVDDLSLLQVLLSLGADVNAVDAQGLTPLMHALRGGCVNVASALAQDGKTRPMVQEQGTLNALTFAVGLKGLVPGALFTLLQRTKRADPELDSLNVFAHTHGPVSHNRRAQRSYMNLYVYGHILIVYVYV
jgi:ankyrin repeat protein